jgi:putative ABC transport system permease protein
MLNQLLNEGITLGLAQAAVALALALAVVLLARQRAIHLERETVIALVRGLIQIVAVGSILALLLQGPSWTSMVILPAMMGAGASIAARRARGIPGAFSVSLAGIGLGGGAVIVVMTWLGVIDSAISSLIPVGSMLIANAMNTSALALERFRAEVESHVGQIEAGLALGATPEATVAPYVQAAVKASLIPRLDSISSLGIVWIPGMMAGMVLSGAEPVYASIYQFVVMAMIFAAGGLTAVVCTRLIRGKAFSEAEQLILRPAATGGSSQKTS